MAAHAGHPLSGLICSRVPRADAQSELRSIMNLWWSDFYGRSSVIPQLSVRPSREKSNHEIRKAVSGLTECLDPSGRRVNG